MTDAGLIRPVFRKVIEQWPDATVTPDGAHGVEVRRFSPPGRQASAAVVVVGINRLDRTLFERSAAHAIAWLLGDGWVIKLLDLHQFPAVKAEPPGEAVRRLLAETEQLRYVLFLTHSRNAINLSDSGNDLVVETPTGGAADVSTPISCLRLLPSAPTDGWVDVFGCFCRPNSQWAIELAKALNWPVRTVYPGYSIYFPAEDHQPKSAIPFTRALTRSRYSRRGWAVWMPGALRPLRVSEPGDTSRRYDGRFDGFERLFVNAISVGLEPVRDFRKKRLLASLGHIGRAETTGARVSGQLATSQVRDRSVI